MLKFSILFKVFTILLFFINSLYAQETGGSLKLKGAVVDTSSSVFLENAVISLLNSADSTFVDFKRSKRDGSFIFENLKAGRYKLLASYPRYADFVIVISLDTPLSVLDLKQISLLPLPQLLDEVVIVGRKAITIKGDTIEYDPDSYVIQPNSRVEDLLKQLPGLQIDRSGQIVAQGRIVKRVLLDGEEFFGDDPTLITRNIRGDMVDKVQLYDKKSGQTDFTGVDDGKRETTLNVKLKEDKKNGYFGKVQAGVGNQDFYESQGMFNRFNNRQKTAAFETIANTGMLGLNRSEGRKYVPQNDVGMGYNSTGMVSGDKLEDTQFDGRGFPEVYSGGFHYDGNWRDKKESININYKIGSLKVVGKSSEEEFRVLPTNVINGTSEQDFNDRTKKHILDAKYETSLDSSSSVRVYLRGGQMNTQKSNHFQSAAFDGEVSQLNENIRDINSEGDERFLQTDFLWNKKMRKPGRTISVALDQVSSRLKRDAILSSTSKYFIDTLNNQESLDQLKTGNDNHFNFNSNVVYTEPLSKKISLSANYRFNLNNGNSSHLSFDPSSDGLYTSLDSLYSNIFKLKQYTNLLGMAFTYNSPKHVVSVGMSASAVNFKQIDVFSDTAYRRNFRNHNSNLNWTFRVSEGKSLRVNYQGFNVLPLITQIQPLLNNLDPLNTIIGNPDLKPSFKHNFSSTYSAYSMLSNRTFMVALNSTVTVNDIAGSMKINERGQSVYKYENMKDRTTKNLSSNIYYGGTLKSMGVSLGGILNLSHGTSYNTINENINKITSNATSVYLNIRKSVKEKYDFNFEGGPTYIENTSSNQKSLAVKGWGANAIGSIVLYIPGKLELGSDASYVIYPSTSLFPNDFSRFLWNASLNRKFLKSNELLLKLTINDILNNNNGYSRTTSQGSIIESNYTTIKRYFLISLIWDFNRT